MSDFNKQLISMRLQASKNEKDRNQAQEGIKSILSFIGEDPEREGLLDTPRRHLKYLEEFCSPSVFNFTVFENENTDEMIVQTDISFYSICEHHLLPFFGKGAIAYIPTDKLVGLSKLARTLDFFSRRPQNQERITIQVADFLQEKLQPKGVAVVLKASHMCMEMRGVQKAGALTTTSCMRGVFREDPRSRKEFFDILK